jgi:hypothetical protein
VNSLRGVAAHLGAHARILPGSDNGLQWRASGGQPAAVGRLPVVEAQTGGKRPDEAADLGHKGPPKRRPPAPLATRSITRLRRRSRGDNHGRGWRPRWPTSLVGPGSISVTAACQAVSRCCPPRCWIGCSSRRSPCRAVTSATSAAQLWASTSLAGSATGLGRPPSEARWWPACALLPGAPVGNTADLAPGLMGGNRAGRLPVGRAAFGRGIG